MPATVLSTHPQVSPQQHILARCRQVVQTAWQILRMDLRNVRITFDLKGRAAGHAIRRGNQYTIRFNNDMLHREAFHHVYKNTVPHEYAHVACFMNPALGRNHDAGWERVCRDLGGSGATRHREEVVFGKGKTYEYTTDNGHLVRLSEKYHAYLQTGKSLRCKNGKGNITKDCPYRIVGANGQSFLEAEKPLGGVLRMPLTPELVNTEQPVPTAQSAEPVSVEPPAEQPAAAPADPPLQPSAGTQHPTKAARSRHIMAVGYAGGATYEQIIAQMMAANGYGRQLARATFKANAAKVGIPASFA